MEIAGEHLFDIAAFLSRNGSYFVIHGDFVAKWTRLRPTVLESALTNASSTGFPMILNETVKHAEALTDSQIRCLRLVGQGMSSKEIAQVTGLSPRTVDQYVNRAALTLGASSRRQAARILSLAESSESNKLQLQSQGVADFSKPGSLSPSGGDQLNQTNAMRIPRWLPPLGGKRHDLKPSETLGEIVKAALIAAIAFGSIVAAGAWLQTLFT